MEVDTRLIDQSQDAKFDAIKSLSWYPWVGKDYFRNTTHRLLIVAESHYNWGENVDELNKALLSHKYITRNVTQYYPVSFTGNNPMFENLHRCLFQTNNIDRQKVWRNIAFYNFVQRSMNYNFKERPNDNDWSNGWQSFVEIIKILRPTECIFVGVGAADKFNENAPLLNLPFESVTWKKVSNCRGGARHFSISVDENYTLNCISIQHTSHHFSWRAWNAYLEKENPALMKFLYTLSKKETKPLEEDQEYISNEICGLPFHLQHKPIYACDYTRMHPNSDLRYITVGRAQWNNKLSASVKTFRWNESKGKWSRMSEEIPIDRLPEMTAVLLSAINATQKARKNDEVKPTYLKESFVVDEPEFLEDQFFKNRDSLKQSLSEIKRLLNEIDLDNI